MYPAYGPSIAGYEENAKSSLVLALPGHGRSKPSCGKVRYGTKCSNPSCEESEKLHLVHDHCDSLLCPVCFENATLRAAERIEERILGMKAAYAAEGIKTGPIDHVELSFPEEIYSIEDLASKEGLNQFIRDHAKLLKTYCNNYGGVLIVHPWRFRHLDGSPCENKKDCQKEHIPVFSPHCHYLGFGYWVKSNIVNKETGAVYKKISPGQARDVKATAAYQLSHCGVLMARSLVRDSESKSYIQGTETFRQVGQAYRWLGMLSQCKGGFKEESRTWDTKLCEKCSCEVHRYDLDIDEKGAYFALGDMGPHLTLTIQGYWFISHRGRQSTILEKRKGD